MANLDAKTDSDVVKDAGGEGGEQACKGFHAQAIESWPWKEEKTTTPVTL
jgi:hypothetical protein